MCQAAAAITTREHSQEGQAIPYLLVHLRTQQQTGQTGGMPWAVRWASQLSFHPLLLWLHICSWYPSALVLPLASFGLAPSSVLQFCLGLHNHRSMFQHRELLFALWSCSIQCSSVLPGPSQPLLYVPAQKTSLCPWWSSLSLLYPQLMQSANAGLIPLDHIFIVLPSMYAGRIGSFLVQRCFHQTQYAKISCLWCHAMVQMPHCSLGYSLCEHMMSELVT